MRCGVPRHPAAKRCLTVWTIRRRFEGLSKTTQGGPMSDIGTASVRGALDSDALSELREGFRGDVIEPGDARYDETRQVFNAMFDRRPAAILRPTGTADVIRAIGLARLTGLPLAVRSGGHSGGGFSSCDGGIGLDLRPLKGIRIDPPRPTARGPGGGGLGRPERGA